MKRRPCEIVPNWQAMMKAALADLKEEAKIPRAAHEDEGRRKAAFF